MTNRNETKLAEAPRPLSNPTQPSFTEEEIDALGDGLQLLFEKRNGEGSARAHIYHEINDLKKKVYSMKPPKPQPPSPQPQPSFTREELEGIHALLDADVTENKSLDTAFDKVEQYLNATKPLPSRLDLLIKFHGEQDRPSELQFGIFKEGIAEPNDDLVYFPNPPSADSTHYRRGTSEWISLEGVV